MGVGCARAGQSLAKFWTCGESWVVTLRGKETALAASDLQETHLSDLDV